jgi:hypothetical protein
MNALWIFREPRSGSTAFSQMVALHTNKTHCFLTSPALSYFKSSPPKLDNLPDESTTVYSTHEFEFLDYMKYYTAPLLIRCTRLDKAEQCLSDLFVNYVNYYKPMNKWVHNIKSDDDANLSAFYTDEPIFISKKQVIDYMMHSNRVDCVWKEKTKQHRTITVYYEDLCNGIDIPEIDFLNCRIDASSPTKKLPNYKSHSIMNESVIREWVAELSQNSG